MSRTSARLRPGSEHRHNGRYRTKENLRAKFRLQKHYRSASAPAPIACEPMDQWTPEEVSAHMQFMADFATRLEGAGEFVDAPALSPPPRRPRRTARSSATTARGGRRSPTGRSRRPRT